ncbi:MAG: MFS transporter [Candidatus Thorarchaeota archaeon]
MLQEITETEKIQKRKKIPSKTILLWIGQQLSLLGSTLTSFVLLWWVSEATQSEFILGIATLMIFIPYILVAPFSGYLIDNVNRKKMLFIVDFFQALFTLILIVIFYSSNKLANSNTLLVSVIVLLALRGIMQVFHEITVTAIIPFLVENEHISRFNSVTFLGGGIARIGGVILLNLIAIENILWIDLITFVITIIPLFISHIPENQVKKESKSSFIKQFKEGIIAIKEIKGLFSTILMVPIVNFFFSPMMTLLPLFVSKIHFGAENHYTIVIILWQVSVIISSSFMCFFKGFKNKVRTSVISICFLFIIQSLVILIPNTIEIRFWLLGSILFCAMIFNPIANISFYTAVQIVIPKEKLGRVTSTIFFIANIVTPIGIFVSGLLGEFIPLNWLFVSSGILGVIMILCVFLFTRSRKLDAVIEEISSKENGNSGNDINNNEVVII